MIDMGLLGSGTDFSRKRKIEPHEVAGRHRNQSQQFSNLKILFSIFAFILYYTIHFLIRRS